MQQRLDRLAAVVKALPPRDWCGPMDPKVGDDPLRFYAFCLAQQCGAGLVTPCDTLSCGNLWSLFHANWNGERDIFGSVSFARFSAFLQPEGAAWKISPGRLFTRYLIHCGIAECRCSLDWLDSTPALAADPFKKRLNLLKNALHCRPEKLAEEEGGPVIDYHVMRVFLRYLGLPLSGDELADEAYLRQSSWDLAWRMQREYALTHDQLDAFLWQLGRSVCRYEAPLCEQCPLSQHCAKGGGAEPRIETFFY